jgi:hypothetical protein
MTTASACAPDAAADETAAILKDMMAYGAKLAQAAAERALRQLASPEGASPAEAKLPEAGLFFYRLWGAMRQTIALQARLTAKPRATARPKTSPAPAAMQPAQAEAAQAAPAKQTAPETEIARWADGMRTNRLQSLMASATHTQPIPGLEALRHPQRASARP